mgnify:CR=1
MTLKDRCKKFTHELGIPVTRFCRSINISTRAYYSWLSDDLKLAESTLTRIDKYLSKYGF